MVVDATTRGEIEKRARLYDAVKGEIVLKIKNNVRVAKEKLDLAEKVLLEEVEIELGENPFANLLEGIDSGNPPTDAEVRSVLEKGVPQDFGPSEESFLSLLKEIEAFKSWRAKKEEKPCVAAPSNVRVRSTTQDSITLAWNDDWRASSYQIEVDGSGSLERVLTNSFTKRGLLAETEHTFRVRSVRGDVVSEWSGVTKWVTHKKHFKESVWKECPDDVNKERKYSVDEKNLRIAMKIDGDGYCTIIGNTTLPPNKVTSWSIKVLESKNNDGDGIYVGASPFGISQNESNISGWFFDCMTSTLNSGPPHNYRWKEYGPRKEKNGEYVRTRGSVREWEWPPQALWWPFPLSSVGVVMDTAKGVLSFVVDGVNHGVAYEGISLDKPLVPCVLLYHGGDSVELDTSGVEEDAVDSSIPVPSNITIKTINQDSISFTWDDDWRASSYQVEVDGSKSLERVLTSTFVKEEFLPDTEHTFRVRVVRGDSVGGWSDSVRVRTQKVPAPSHFKVKSATHGSITLAWNEVEGASFYKVEVDGSKSLERVTANSFVKDGLLPGTEHNFRVCVVKGDSASEWSDAVKGRTIKSYEGVWKECPGYVDKRKKYSIDGKNPRIATLKGGDLCTIVGNTLIPLNQVTLWSVKILKSEKNDGNGILIGVAPPYINQDERDHNLKSGYYFDCCHSSLRSGPPHNYEGKKYGPRKGYGKYVHTGDSVGVVMDTAKGELSFALNGVDLGVAYEGIPLDNPLVPCVIIAHEGDSVELLI